MLNVLLFLPFGIALGRSQYQPVTAVLAVVATTVGIEALQYSIVVGRDGSVRDVLANCLGGAAGYLLSPHLHHACRPDRRIARRLVWGAAGLWVAHACLATMAFRSSPTAHRYYGQWASTFEGFDTFNGTVVGATIDGAPLPTGPFPAALEGAVRDIASPFDLSATVSPGRPSTRLAPIVSVADEMGNEIGLLGQQQNALVFRTRLDARRMGFGAPTAVLVSAFPGPTAPEMSLIAVGGSLRKSVLRVRALYQDGEIMETALPLTPSLGWTLWWAAFPIPGPSTVVWITWFWLAAPMVIMGFWSAAERQGSGRNMLGAMKPPMVAAVLVQIVIPAMFGPGWFPPIGDVLATSIGLACGIGSVAFVGCHTFGR